MRRRIPILGIALATVLLAVSSSGTSPVEALNDTVQERFRTLDGFGMARIPAVPQHVYEFDPQTPDEKAAVEDLRKQGWTVGLYLGGRGLLRPPLSESEWEKAGEHSTRRAISPPLVISRRVTPAGLPKPWELQAIGRKALDASARSDPSVDGRSMSGRSARAERRASNVIRRGARPATGGMVRGRRPTWRSGTRSEWLSMFIKHNIYNEIIYDTWASGLWARASGPSNEAMRRTRCAGR
jgi:hypothetical protein